MKTLEDIDILDECRQSLRKQSGLKDRMEMRANCHVRLFDKHGRVKARRDVHNLVVTTGRDAIIERLDSTPATAQPSHMEIGTSATAVGAGQTALVAALDRNALSSNTASGGVLTMVGNWAAGDGTSATIQEAGIFNAASTGTMYSRATFTAINKGASDTLQITWTYTLTPS